MDWHAVFFDFDGVILNSVDVKTKAFAQMFRSYGPEVEKAVVRYHLENGGLSRYEKFLYYYERLLQKPLSENELEELGRQFSKLVVQKVVDSPFVPGALESLQELKKHEVPVFLVSGTPEEEIKLIVQKKGLEGYFEEVHGSPRKKKEIVQEILQRKILPAKNCIFIGDALSDLKAAQQSGLNFLGIVSKEDKSIFPNGTPISHEVNLTNIISR